MPFLQDIREHPSGVLSGLLAGAPSFALSRLIADEDPLEAPALALPLLVVAPTEEAAAQRLQELRFHLRIIGSAVEVVAFPADDVRPFEGLSPHPDVPRQRLVALARLLAGAPAIVVASARALQHRVLPPDVLRQQERELVVGETLDRDALVAALVSWGYLVTSHVEEPGTVSYRGGTIDIWPTGEEGALRVSLFDDEIEEIRRLQALKKGHAERLQRLLLLPAREAVLSPDALRRAADYTAAAVDAQGEGHARRRQVLQDLREGLWFPGAEDYLPALHPLALITDYVPRIAVIGRRDVREELKRFDEVVQSRWKRADDEERPLILPDWRFAPAEAVEERLAGALALEAFAPEAPDFRTKDNSTLQAGKGTLAPVAEQLKGWAADGWQVALVCDSAARAERVNALLGPHGVLPRPAPAATSLPPGRITLWIGDLPQGFHAPDSQLAVVTADEIFGARERSAAPRVPKSLREAALSSFAELKAGDLVVHARHGIGRFIGLKRLDVHGVQQDFTEVEYRNGDRLYLPVTRLEQLYRYRAMGDVQPSLDKLGGETWAVRRKRVADRLLSLAAELLGLHAIRASAPGYAYEGLPAAYHQFAETFPYVETPDQETAIEEVLADLARAEPMDRLLVGDVGFGKTEVAMRAAMRVVLEGHQVAILCPTTVLAFQHHETFLERFDGMGARIALLSRFQTAAEARDILKRVRAGEIDILIGTVKLLARQLSFHRLGLVVVDEEHRFGVQQKEKLKKIRLGEQGYAVHYLAMSATPIPRTLHMAMSGLRKISLITTPPAGRQAVRTDIVHTTDDHIQENVRRELGRGGQVFFVHNRIEDIGRWSETLRRLVPEAHVGVAHGQMEEGALEEVLIDFIRRRLQVLVCTTIIESGVDLPNVNTMLIHDAHRLGLAQLYQLRGRVGRGARRGYCTLLIPPHANLPRDAERRLHALQEHTELGSGFAIANADLELRGSGNLLGAAQHGHIQAVGLDTYVELLEEAAAAARGEHARQRLDPELEIPVPTLIPESYIPDVEERLTEYRRIAMVRTAQQVRDLVKRWEIEYGEPPPEVLNLGWAAEAKIRCRELGIERVNWLKVRAVLTFHPTTSLSPARLAKRVQEWPNRFSLESEGGVTRVSVRFTPEEAEWPFRFLHWVFQALIKE